MKVTELAGYGLPEGAIEIIRDHGIKELFPPQEDAIRAGLLDLYLHGHLDGPIVPKGSY